MPIIGQISVGDGATFTPAVSSTGELSWSNNKNLPNPASVDIPQTVMDRYQIAPIASPAFTGNPTAPTQAKTDDSTKLATTAYVKAVVADYLELTGGSITGDVDITGDLSVSGTITGNVTGNVTGNLTGNATNDANGNPIASTYLPLAGGTMSGSIATNIADIITRAADNGTVRIDGGSGYGKGACFYAAGKDYEGTGAGGHFIIEANNGTTQYQLKGDPNTGTLTWRGYNLGVAAVASNYIRYDNGLQICWGHTANKTVNGNSNTSQMVTFPVAFKNSDYSVSVTSRYVSGSWTNNTTLINNNTTTSVELFIDNATSSAYTFYFVWIAVGSWK